MKQWLIFCLWFLATAPNATEDDGKARVSFEVVLLSATDQDPAPHSLLSRARRIANVLFIRATVGTTSVPWQ
eukprot:11207816-Lingulodinium_polyedra.AAC.1